MKYMKMYIEKFKKEHIVYKAITIGIVIFIVFFIGRIIKNTIVGLDYPNEILEPANVLLTKSLLNGNVPYNIKNAVTPGIEPPVNFEYPFLNNIVAAGFSFLTGGNVILAHYIVSFLAMVISAVIVWVILNRYSNTTVGPTMGFLLTMFCHWRYGYISASPDGFGLFVALLTLYLATMPKLKYRPLWCAIGTVAAFYSKQYYAGICISIFVFMLMYSKKSALKYFGWCVVFLASTMAIITWKWQLFWTYSVLLLMHGCFQGWGADGFLYVLEQMKYLSFVFIGMIAILIVALTGYIKKRRLDRVASTNENIASGKAAEKKNLVNEGDALPLFLIQIPVQILMLFIFGRNDGAYLTYFLQLLIPSLSIAALLLLESMKPQKYEIVFMGVYAFIALFTIYFGWGKLPMHMLTESEVETWEYAYSLIDEYREKGQVYFYNATAYSAINNGDSVFGIGHSGDINQNNYDDWKNNKVQQFLFPNADLVFEENLAYRDVMRQKAENNELSLITTPEGEFQIPQELMLEYGYTKIETIPLRVGNMEYVVEFWAVN